MSQGKYWVQLKMSITPFMASLGRYGGCVCVALAQFGVPFAQAEDAPANIQEQVTNILGTILERNSLYKSVLGDDMQIVGDLRPITSANAANPEANPPGAVTQQPQLDRPRDPFSVSNTLRQKLQGNERNGQSQFQQGQFTQTIPRLKLKGIVVDKKTKQPLALLNIGDQTVHLVREQDEISFDPVDPKQVIKIQKITSSNVIVEVGTLGDLILVR